MSPQTAPLMFLPSHLKLIVARPVPEATVTGMAKATLLPPNVTVGVPGLQSAGHVVDRDLQVVVAEGDAFLTVPRFLTLMFLRSSVTWSTTPVTTR